MENTLIDAGKFLEWFEENVTKIDMPFCKKISLPGLLYHYADFVEKNKPTEQQKRRKEEIISSIKNRIESEQRKHQKLDWAEMAARKIYSTYFDNENNLLINPVEDN